jgi:hypothetical protein
MNPSENERIAQAYADTFDTPLARAVSALLDERRSLDHELRLMFTHLTPPVPASAPPELDMDEALHLAHAEIEQLRTIQRLAGDLLAVIHGDGGHHINDVGWERAFEGAERFVVRLRGERESVRSKEREREEKARALWEQGSHHTYAEVTHDRDDRPIPPTCAHCGRVERYCTGDKP